METNTEKKLIFLLFFLIIFVFILIPFSFSITFESYITVNGSSAFDRLGESTCFGDFNGDGYDDLIVGGYLMDPGGVDRAGQVLIYYGGKNLNRGINYSPYQADISINGTGIRDYVGFSLAISDINNDSFEDLIVGAYGRDSGGINDEGRVSIFYGSNISGANYLIHDSNITINGTIYLGEFGKRVSKAGDLNNDGYNDFLIGTEKLQAGGLLSSGRAYVFYGSSLKSANLFDYQANITINGSASNGWFAMDLDGVGDINNDGYDDLIVGERQINLGGLGIGGRAVIFYGSNISGANYLSYDANITVNATRSKSQGGTSNFTFLGGSVSDAGDFNGDGFQDFAVGVPAIDSGGLAYAGQILIFYGNNFGNRNIHLTADDANVTINGTSSSNANWHPRSSVGDFNNDGYSDLFFTNRNYNSGGITKSGNLRIFYGGLVGGGEHYLDNHANVTINGTYEEQYFGYSISVMGNLNGDNFYEFAVGSPYVDAGGLNNAGQLILYTNNLDPLVYLDTPFNYSGLYTDSPILNYNVSDFSEIINCSLLINGELNRTNSTITKYTTEKFSEKFPITKFNWTVKCYDSLNNKGSVNNHTLTVLKAENYNLKKQLTHIDIRNFSGFYLGKSSNGLINWTENISLGRGLNLDNESLINISKNKVKIDSTSFPELNKSAQITLYNLTFNATPLILKNGFLCSDCVVENYNLSTGTLIFNVTHFTTYEASGNTNLTIWDSADLNIPYGDQTITTSDTAFFYANYTNVSFGDLWVNSNCSIHIDGGIYNMTYDATKKLYQYSSSFNQAVTYDYTIYCNSSNSEYLFASDSISINGVSSPGPGGPSNPSSPSQPFVPHQPTTPVDPAPPYTPRPSQPSTPGSIQGGSSSGGNKIWNLPLIQGSSLLVESIYEDGIKKPTIKLETHLGSTSPPTILHYKNWWWLLVILLTLTWLISMYFARDEINFGKDKPVRPKTKSFGELVEIKPKKEPVFNEPVKEIIIKPKKDLEEEDIVIYDRKL